MANSISGFGIGLRSPHYEQILSERPKSIDWLEILSDNYLNAHGGYLAFLQDLRQDYPMAMHGVSLSIGSTNPLNKNYILKLKDLADRLQIDTVSDHLCYTGIMGKNTHDLLPIPYTDEALHYIASRIDTVQEILNRPLILENPSTYLEFGISCIHEAEFLATLSQQTGCKILLDVNNIYVSGFNHGWNPQDYPGKIPSETIAYYHIAGYTHNGTHIIDTHNSPASDEVLELYEKTIEQKGVKPVLFEWDEDIPELDVVLAELEKLRCSVREVA